MTILAWVVLGLISGFIASMIVDAHVALDTVLGIAGAIVGGLAFSAVGADGISEFNLWSLFVAATGSALVLAGYHALSRHRGLA